MARGQTCWKPRRESSLTILTKDLQATRSVVVQPTGLTAALREVTAKREADLIRFRTCCADPRASK